MKKRKKRSDLIVMYNGSAFPSDFFEGSALNQDAQDDTPIIQSGVFDSPRKTFVSAEQEAEGDFGSNQQNEFLKYDQRESKINSEHGGQVDTGVNAKLSVSVGGMQHKGVSGAKTMREQSKNGWQLRECSDSRLESKDKTRLLADTSADQFLQNQTPKFNEPQRVVAVPRHSSDHANQLVRITVPANHQTSQQKKQQLQQQQQQLFSFTFAQKFTSSASMPTNAAKLHITQSVDDFEMSQASTQAEGSLNMITLSQQQPSQGSCSVINSTEIVPTKNQLVKSSIQSTLQPINRSSPSLLRLAANEKPKTSSSSSIGTDEQPIVGGQQIERLNGTVGGLLRVGSISKLELIPLLRGQLRKQDSSRQLEKHEISGSGDLNAISSCSSSALLPSLKTIEGGSLRQQLHLYRQRSDRQEKPVKSQAKLPSETGSTKTTARPTNGCSSSSSSNTEARTGEQQQETEDQIKGYSEIKTHLQEGRQITRMKQWSQQQPYQLIHTAASTDTDSFFHPQVPPPPPAAAAAAAATSPSPSTVTGIDRSNHIETSAEQQLPSVRHKRAQSSATKRYHYQQVYHNSSSKGGRRCETQETEECSFGQVISSSVVTSLKNLEMDCSEKDSPDGDAMKRATLSNLKMYANAKKSLPKIRSASKLEGITTDPISVSQKSTDDAKPVRLIKIYRMPSSVSGAVVTSAAAAAAVTDRCMRDAGTTRDRSSALSAHDVSAIEDRKSLSTQNSERTLLLKERNVQKRVVEGFRSTSDLSKFIDSDNTSGINNTAGKLTQRENTQTLYNNSNNNNNSKWIRTSSAALKQQLQSNNNPMNSILAKITQSEELQQLANKLQGKSKLSSTDASQFLLPKNKKS